VRAGLQDSTLSRSGRRQHYRKWNYCFTIFFYFSYSCLFPVLFPCATTIMWYYHGHRTSCS